jgi:hypothetical protein
MSGWVVGLQRKLAPLQSDSPKKAFATAQEIIGALKTAGGTTAAGNQQQRH